MLQDALSAGDLFEVPAPDGRVGYGQIVIPGSLLYIVIFEPLFQDTRPSCSRLISTAFLIGWTTDALLYHRKWKVVGNCPIPKGLPFPNYKVKIGNDLFITDFDGKPIRRATSMEAGLLSYKGGFSPAVFEDALFAHHRLANFQMMDELSIARSMAQCITGSKHPLH